MGEPFIGEGVGGVMLVGEGAFIDEHELSSKLSIFFCFLPLLKNRYYKERSSMMNKNSHANLHALLPLILSLK